MDYDDDMMEDEMQSYYPPQCKVKKDMGEKEEPYRGRNRCNVHGCPNVGNACKGG